MLDRGDIGPAGRDHIWLNTVGVDIGSSTSHMTLARIHLQRLSDNLSSRYVVVERATIFESSIRLTPYLPDHSIDADELATFVDETYRQAGVTTDSIDTGAVILTGEAVKRRNARAINARLASIAGSFVSTTAGPRLEAVIAAHGSGAVALSKRSPSERVLNVDIGGGTTKFALVIDGHVAATGAISVGGRLIASGASAGSPVDRIEPDGAWFADRLGFDISIGRPIQPQERLELGREMASVIMRVLRGAGDDPDLAPLWVTPPFVLDEPASLMTISGGVAQYALLREATDFGDLGPALGMALRDQLTEAGMLEKLAPSAETIRATVIGASQYTVQVSGNTVALSDPGVLPLSDVRVVSPDAALPIERDQSGSLASAIAERIDAHDVGRDVPVALAFRWTGIPLHSRLLALAEAIVASVSPARAHHPLVILLDGDIARSLGGILQEELGWTGQLVCLDGVRVDDFEYVDVGTRIEPAGTYPVVVKSLVYPTP